jgi:hypothetical protein
MLPSGGKAIMTTTARAVLQAWIPPGLRVGDLADAVGALEGQD